MRTHAIALTGKTKNNGGSMNPLKITITVLKQFFQFMPQKLFIHLD
ncbi:MAG: hypothetical protein GX927_03150 [Lentisphaerae bacterium]|nr:hypothetical protein [Lentisphaerota bacterium]